MRIKSSEFNRLVKKLEKHFPASHPILIDRCSLENVYGDCSFHENHYLIRIEKNLDHCASMCILIHEWAHALTWPLSNISYRDHDDLWGVTFAKIWSVIVDKKRKNVV